MLARNSTLHLNSLLDHAMHHSFGSLSLRIVAAPCHILLGVFDQIWQLAHGHGDVASPHVVAGLLDSRCAPQSLLSCTPQLILLLLALGELEGLAAGLLGKAFDLGDLLLDTSGSTSELEEKRGRLGPGSNAGRLGLDSDLEGGFSHKTESSLRANEKLGKVVASRTLTRPLPGLDDGAVGENNSQAEDPFTHGTVAVGISTAASSTDHASNHSTRAGVGREEKTFLAKVIVQSLPAHSGLDNNIEILLVKVDDLVHTAEIDRNTLASRGKVTFKTSTAAVARNRDLAFMADLHNIGHLLSTSRVDNTKGSIFKACLVRGPA
ncbi:hypothetical protein HG530_004263 [Fusarium avenaceum]|nr:hypothetical protein HG530_004263 [Fusarium avenaceum]